MNFGDAALVGAAGSAGAGARYLLDGALRRRLVTELPIGTVTINITGSFVLGVLAGVVLYHGAPSRLDLVGGTGFCGGYTTFSTASFETVRLAQDRARGAAAMNLVLTVVGTLAAAALGLTLAYFT